MKSSDAFDPQFESRKRDHIRLALSEKNQAKGLTGLDLVRLRHEALPELNFSEVSLTTTFLNQMVPVPVYVNSMTAGHEQGKKLNQLMASVCGERGWVMGVGSQRRQLSQTSDSAADTEMQLLKQQNPRTKFMGNLGLSQLIEQGPEVVQRLVDSVEAIAMIIHTNPLQESLQPEGTPQFKGGLQALEKLCKALSVPVVLKETGCGFSSETVRKLQGIGIAALDVSGLGGTHWGRIEGDRADERSVQAKAAVTLQNWGLSTVESLAGALEVKPSFEVWASGGVRTGLDAAKLIALGADAVGLAQPILAAALQGEKALSDFMELVEFELKTILFCTGSRRVSDLRGKWML
ncbi:MAG: type 2 isopentenyl-diphosphate Delta-isomerase [Bdellovibrionales bacterium]